MKPIVGNVNVSNHSLKSAGEGELFTASNGVSSNMEEQCNSCSCFYHHGPSSQDQSTGASQMKLREHNENCYENQYMVDVKAKNNAMLFANDVC